MLPCAKPSAECRFVNCDPNGVLCEDARRMLPEYDKVVPGMSQQLLDEVEREYFHRLEMQKLERAIRLQESRFALKQKFRGEEINLVYTKNNADRMFQAALAIAVGIAIIVAFALAR